MNWQTLSNTLRRADSFIEEYDDHFQPLLLKIVDHIVSHYNLFTIIIKRLCYISDLLFSQYFYFWTRTEFHFILASGVICYGVGRGGKLRNLSSILPQLEFSFLKAFSKLR